MKIMINFIHVPFFDVWTEVFTDFIISDVVSMMIHNFKISFSSQPRVLRNTNGLSIT